MTDTNKLKDLAEPCSMCGGKGYYCEFSTLETCWCVEPATKADEASELRAEVDKLKRLIAERWKPEVERLRKVEALQKQVNEHYKRWYRECIDEPFDTWLKDDATHWIGEQDAAFQAWQYLHENKIWLMKERIEEHEQERDRLKAENEVLRESLQALIHISDATGWEDHTCGEIAKARAVLEGAKP
ncbi:hypothetical protein ACM7V5_02510 [Pseudomonas aeruginosa]